MTQFKLCALALTAFVVCTFIIQTEGWGYRIGGRHGGGSYYYRRIYNHRYLPSFYKSGHVAPTYYTTKPTPKTIYNVEMKFERAFCENGVPGNGKKDGKYAHPKHCEKYIVCHGFENPHGPHKKVQHGPHKKVQVKACDDGFFFNSKNGICDWPSEVDCFLYQGRTCYGAGSTKNTQYGSVKATRTGYLRGIKLLHAGGYVTCHNKKPTYKSFWGCNTKVEGFNKKVNTWVTTNKGVDGIIFPNYGTQYDKYGNYHLDGYNNISPYIKWISKPGKPTKLHRGDQIKIWYGEDLYGQHLQDNAGDHCVDVYALFSYYRPYFYFEQNSGKKH